jgi:hypothetical protein
MRRLPSGHRSSVNLSNVFMEVEEFFHKGAMPFKSTTVV